VVTGLYSGLDGLCAWSNAHLWKLSVAIRDHLDVGSFASHGLAPLPHHKDAAKKQVQGSAPRFINNASIEKLFMHPQSTEIPRTPNTKMLQCTVSNVGITSWNQFQRNHIQLLCSLAPQWKKCCHQADVENAQGVLLYANMWSCVMPYARGPQVNYGNDVFYSRHILYGNHQTKAEQTYSLLAMTPT